MPSRRAGQDYRPLRQYRTSRSTDVLRARADGNENLLFVRTPIPTRNSTFSGLLVSVPHERRILSGPSNRATAAGKAVNMKTPRFREQDIPIAITTLIQVLVVQLLDSDVLTVEQAEQVFDGAAKRSARLKEAAPDAQRLIQHLHDELNWDKYYKSAADRRRYHRERD
jgi:hypothetical protein